MKEILKNNKTVIVSAFLALLTLVFGVTQMPVKDFGRILAYAAAYSALGLVMLPLVSFILGDFCDGGWLASKTVGLYFSGWIMWVFSSIHFLKFCSWAAWGLILLVTAAVYFLRLRGERGRMEFLQYARYKVSGIALTESIFFAIFVFACWYLGHKIPSYETERVMDYAIMAALNKTDYMPPVDMWAAGNYLNYYYFGQYIITYLGKLIFTSPDYSYTLGFNLIIPVVFMGVFVLVKTIMRTMAGGNKGILSTVAGCISGVAVTFSSNMHYFVFYLLNKRFGNIFRLPVDMPDYWFANSSRYIGYYPENMSDRTIIEFPVYSFLIGDLHAHVINMMLVIAILMMAYGYSITAGHRQEIKGNGSLLLNYILSPYIILIGFMLGISSMSNSWDLPIYFVVCGSLVLFTNIKSDVKWGIINTLIQGLWIGFLVLLVALPFNLKFVAMVSGIGIVQERSMLHQLVIVWGYPIILVISFVIYCIRKKMVTTQELFVFLVGLCATGLALMPEFIYARDIYENGFPRANTMFKLSYEAFILFGICSGLIIVKFLSGKEKLLRMIGILGLGCSIMCAGYFITASRQWMGNVFKADNEYIGIDAMYTFKNENGVDSQAIQFLTDYVEGKGEKRPFVLEADGDSYTNSCRVSALTGYPTIMGWNTHEWLWLDGYDKMNLRKTDAATVYTGTDAKMTRSILDNYNIEYVFIGKKEYERYGTVQNGIIESMGNVIYSQTVPDGTYIEIIEIDR